MIPVSEVPVHKRTSTKPTKKVLGAKLASNHGGYLARRNGLGDRGAGAYRRLLEDMPVGLAIATPEGDLLYVNARFREILQQPSLGEPTRKKLKSFIEPYCWGQLESALARGVSEGAEGEVKVYASDGVRRTLRLAFSPFPAETGSVRIVAEDITELAKAREDLQHSEEFVNSLSARLLHVQDEERRRLARDLHDTTGQEIAVALMTLDNLARNLQKPGVNVVNRLAEAVRWLRKVESGIRTFSYLLHPPLLDEMGLGSALSWYIEGFVKRSGINVGLSIPEDLPRLSEQTETALFRVTQESLTNVLRHSHSRKAWVNVSVSCDCLKLVVRDEGKGFAQKRLQAAPSPGVGIEGMKGRLKAVEGTLTVESGQDGTTVTASVPLAAMADSAARKPFQREDDGKDVSIGSKRVLIVDDHEVARQGIRFLLSEQHDLQVCGEAQSGPEAVVKTQELNPDLVILDLSMPGGGGLSAAHRIRKAGLTTKILIYTTHAYAGLERIARAAECDGFVLKADASKDLIRGIRAVLRGEQFFNSEERGEPLSEGLAQRGSVPRLREARKGVPGF